MRLLIVTGIYPPDIGGPATHAADLAVELRKGGHYVHVLTLWDGMAEETNDGATRFPRRRSVLARMSAVAMWIAKNGVRFDAIYATGLHTEAVIGARLAGVPSIVKVVGDPVWERGRRLGLTTSNFEAFQMAGRPKDLRLRALAWLRDRTLRASTAIVAPSRYLADVVESWLDGPSDVRVIENGVRLPADMPALPSPHPGLRVAYVGRLVQHKRVDRLIAAMTDGVHLDVVGSGPEEGLLRAASVSEGRRVTFHGNLPRADVFARIAAADVLALASDYEGLPHVVIEALVMGTLVVSPAVGGVTEVVTDGENGIILDDADPATLCGAFVRLRDDHELLERLAAGARESGTAWRMERTAARVVGLLDEHVSPRPRAVFLGKTHTPNSLPTGSDERSRYEIVSRYTRPTVIGVGVPGVRRLGRTAVVSFPEMRPRVLEAALYYAAAPVLGALLAAGRMPSVVVAQSPYEGFGALVARKALPSRLRPRVVVEVHGDWRTATRLYGSPARRLLSPAADSLASWTVRHADVARAIGSFTEELIRGVGYEGPIDVYGAFGGLDAFLATPPAPVSDEPEALFVGALEPTKSLDVLLEAWRVVASTVPGARLGIIGVGSSDQSLRRQAALAGLTSSVRFLGRCDRSGVIAALDRARLLTLPSRSEGMGRVILEAFARGRPVVATAVGGIPEVVTDGETGILVAPEDPAALAKALITMLIADRTRIDLMGQAARSSVEARQGSEASFAAGVKRLTGWAR